MFALSDCQEFPMKCGCFLFQRIS